MFQRSVDDQDDIIFVSATGIWDRTEIDRHYAELGRLVADRRTAGKPIRVLIDLTKSPRQAPETEAYVKGKIGGIYQAGDRVATLVASDDKSYMRATLGLVEVATFSSRLPAEIWLMEPSLKRPG
jgi:hypothetical protein